MVPSCPFDKILNERKPLEINLEQAALLDASRKLAVHLLEKMSILEIQGLLDGDDNLFLDIKHLFFSKLSESNVSKLSMLRKPFNDFKDERVLAISLLPEGISPIH